MDDEQTIYTRLQLRPVHVLCPTCFRVIRRESEAADTPTATTRMAKEPCATCLDVRG